MVDGDGSLGITKQNYPFVSFVSESREIVDYILDFISDITGNDKKTLNRNKRDNIYNVMITREDAIKFCKIVYYDNCLSLNRKYEKSKEVRNWIRTNKKIDFKRKFWTKEEDDYILEHEIEESMEILGRTEKSIKIRLMRLENGFSY